MSKIHPRCVHGITETYISAEGYVYPCCWIANQPHVRKVQTLLGEHYEDLSLAKNNIDAIIKGPAFKMIEDTWISGDFEPCRRFCSKPIDHDPENKRNKPDKHYHINI